MDGDTPIAKNLLTDLLFELYIARTGVSVGGIYRQSAGTALSAEQYTFYE